MSNIVAQRRKLQISNSEYFMSISTLILRIYFPILIIIIGCFYIYHYYLIFSMKSNLVQNSSNVLFTEEQLQYLPPGTKYRLYQSPPNMPSILLTLEEETKIANERSIYGGKFDKPHLGGFTEYDSSGVSYNTFDFMIGGLAIKSLIDVGCGKGVSTKYFYEKGLKVLCVEGSHDAVLQMLLPKEKVIEHDFSRGPWWPTETYDAAWSVEFLEHVGRQYMDNYMPIFHKSALIFVTASGWGGWHHVEVHGPWWWKARFAAEGFIFSPELTTKVSIYADEGRAFPIPGRKSDHVIDASHIIHSMYVYINPMVANLPKHKHLIGGHGCYDNTIENQMNGLPCTGVDTLPTIYQALQNCYVKDKKQWICEKNLNAIPQL